MKYPIFLGQFEIVRIKTLMNYYYINRHTIFHFGDLMGNIDTSRMIETKTESDEIIDTTIKMINDTVS